MTCRGDTRHLGERTSIDVDEVVLVWRTEATQTADAFLSLLDVYFPLHVVQPRQHLVAPVLHPSLDLCLGGICSVGDEFVPGYAAFLVLPLIGHIQFGCSRGKVCVFGFAYGMADGALEIAAFQKFSPRRLCAVVLLATGSVFDEPLMDLFLIVQTMHDIAS